MNCQLITRSANGWFVHEPMPADKALAWLAERVDFYSVTMPGEVVHYGMFDSNFRPGRYDLVNVDGLTVLMPWMVPINSFSLM